MPTFVTALVELHFILLVSKYIMLTNRFPNLFLELETIDFRLSLSSGKIHARESTSN